MDSSSDAAWGAVGLAPLTGRILEHLIGRPVLTEDEIASAVEYPAEEIGEALRALESEHLVVRTGIRPTRWAAGPPRSTLGALLARRRQELARTELYMERLQEAYRSVPSRRVTSDLFEVVESADQVAARYAQLLASSKREVLHLAKPPYLQRSPSPVRAAGTEPVAGPQPKPDPDPQPPEGVRLRSVYDSDGFTDAVSLKTAVRGTARGGRLRLLPGLPMKLVVFDDTAGMIPLSKADPAAGSVIVHASPLLDALTALFESLWERATPVSMAGTAEKLQDRARSEEGGLSGRARDILDLMAAGLTDDAIARALGLSRRTIQKHISGTADALGARTRFQIALLARERGWIGRR
ncbi:helix-turn-helix transcriptional regulator [Streptomyces sp. AK02-01A]|uniref:helix-turn-helix transcriptional regulator n=1 Tax=Streptomyces sp. AK02-01A TaxID=3028648 RepID=UPI0029BB24E9|nr:LuxR C-terminal-related transcriptional regulator [Streptomyces sp. AK02-01A]MDX3849534.1 LuxR C-terminal-related transcriptional regulator [Streptomyces sp. AK02-01A]MDX3849896.1 LuxR C-terminal-related transcriptional regulator [Streptomyces sp. AK02-01A]